MALFFSSMSSNFFEKRRAKMYMIQSVLNKLKNINPSIREYMLGLLLSRGRKNCAAMADSLLISPKRFYNFLAKGLDNSKEIEKILFDLAKETRIKGVPRTLIVDPSTIIKTYAKSMEKLCYDRSGCSKKIEWCLVPIYAAIADENITIPLAVEFWVQQKVVGKSRYKSKIQITQELILYLVSKGVSFDYISLDGAFATAEMFAFFAKNKHLRFSIRIPSNRVIKTSDGIKAQLKKHPALQLHRNEREKTIQASIKGISYYFTVQKRKAVGSGWEKVFIVSDMNVKAKEQISAYARRWPLEKANRTGKQKFGAGQCQAISATKQKAHIMAGFLTYTVCDLIKNDNMSQSVDELVNKIRKTDSLDWIYENQKMNKTNHRENIHPVEKSVQNQVQNFSQYTELQKEFMH